MTKNRTLIESGPAAVDAFRQLVRHRLEEKGPRVVGRWFDTFRYADGTVEAGPHGEFDWGWNQIQNSFASLLSAWCRGETGYDRINYMGIGSGLVAWDTTPPTQSYSQTTLTTEYFRKAVQQTDIVYIDPITNLPTGGTPSPKIEISVTLLSAEANGTLREFGLFGGTATSTLDSGEMVNWIVHPRIDKDSSLEIDRRVRLEFETQ